MAGTVIAGLDGTTGSVAASDWAAREAQRRGADVRLVHVQEHTPHYDERRGVVGGVRPGTLEELRARHPHVRMVLEEAPGQPAAALSDVSEDAELLVLGCRDLHTTPGFLLGSVSLATVARTMCPLVLVRPSGRPEDEHLPDASGLPSTATPYREVVLAVAPDSCGKQTAFAFDAAGRRGATLHAVYGWRPLPVPPDSPEALALGRTEELEADAARLLAERLAPWRERFPEVEVKEETSLGPPGRLIVEAAQGAGLLVLGRPARHKPYGAYVGPATYAALHHAPCPVAVVPES